MSATETAPVAVPDDLRNGGDPADETVDELDALPGDPEPPIDDVVDEPVDEAPAPPSGAAAARARTSRVMVRRVDPWSVLKLSLLFYLCVCLVLLVAGCILWAGASAAGVVENVEGFASDIGFDDFRFVAADILRASTIGGLVLVVSGTLANTLLAVLFNLMGDLVGGLKVTLAEDVRKPRRRR